nr:MAG TPA: hypothetical protein [Bacteriophage sp.]
MWAPWRTTPRVPKWNLKNDYRNNRRYLMKRRFLENLILILIAIILCLNWQKVFSG